MAAVPEWLATHLPVALAALLLAAVVVVLLARAVPWRRGAPAMLAVVLALFALLASMPPTVVAFDQALADALRQHASRPTLEAAFAVTQLGNFATLLAIGLAVALWLIARRRWAELLLWLAVTAGNGMLNNALKRHFERLRPLHAHGLVSETAYSFPSGHASGALAVYGLLAVLLLPQLAPAYRLPLLLATVVLVLLIGASRVILQVHFASDVVAGYASASALLIAALMLRGASGGR